MPSCTCSAGTCGWLSASSRSPAIGGAELAACPPAAPRAGARRAPPPDPAAARPVRRAGRSSGAISTPSRAKSSASAVESAAAAPGVEPASSRSSSAPSAAASWTTGVGFGRSVVLSVDQRVGAVAQQPRAVAGEGVGRASAEPVVARRATRSRSDGSAPSRRCRRAPAAAIGRADAPAPAPAPDPGRVGSRSMCWTGADTRRPAPSPSGCFTSSGTRSERVVEPAARRAAPRPPTTITVALSYRRRSLRSATRPAATASAPLAGTSTNSMNRWPLCERSHCAAVSNVSVPGRSTTGRSSRVDAELAAVEGEPARQPRAPCGAGTTRRRRRWLKPRLRSSSASVRVSDLSAKPASSRTP